MSLRGDRRLAGRIGERVEGSAQGVEVELHPSEKI